MNFNSLLFIIFFLPIFFVTFYLVKNPYRYLVVLVGSFIFYLYSGWLNTVILLGMTVLDYFAALLIEKKRSRLYMIAAVAINIASLAFFKYNRSLILPLGISFYTFNNISYLVDVGKGKIRAERHILYYLTYAILFAHVTMGPITKYSTIREKIRNLNPTFDEAADGFRRFFFGLIKKVLVADNLGLLYSSLTSADKSTMLYILMLVVFGLQLYIDFSSYSDMAIGLGKMMGITYPENFDHPYLALSVSDFWRKWHMSLTNFFKEYVYIPLGGNRVPKWRHILNIMIVWGLTGIWHGSSINFLFWGLYYGVILIIEKYFLLNKLEKAPNYLRHIYVLMIVLIGYIFFSITDSASLAAFFKGFFSSGFINSTFLFYIKENWLLIIAGIILCLKMPEKIKHTLDNNRIAIIAMDVVYVALFILTISYIVSGSYLPFLYSAF